MERLCSQYMWSSLKRGARNKFLSNVCDVRRRRNSTNAPLDDKSPLSGIRVLDLTRIVAGPYCTMILGDLGAEIIKIERPYVGDDARKWGPPFFEGTKESTYFTSVNRNKKSICVDLKKGQNLIYELAKRSDILVENYVPGKLTEMGLGYEQLAEKAPRLIYCSLTGYGSDGPYANRAGYDVIAASIGGLLHITGPKDGPPCKTGVAMTDMATGLYAHGAIMAAIIQRMKTNKGQWIQCNLLATQVASLINIASNYLNANKEGTRWGSEHESIVPYEAFPTKDGYFTIGIGTDIHFKELLKRMSLSHLSEMDEFKNNAARVKNRVVLLGILRAELAKKTNKEWAIIFDGSPFAYGEVNTISQVFKDPHVIHMDMVKELDHPTVGQVKVVGPPVKYSYAKNVVRTAPPTLGQHTVEILRNVLHYSDDTIQTLMSNKIVQ